MMRKFLPLLPALLLVAALVIPDWSGSVHAQTAPTASIRLVQTVPDAPPVDVYINGKLTSTGLNFQAIADYTDLSGGTYDIKVYPSSAQGQGTPLLDLKGYNLTSGSKSTVIVAGLYNQKAVSALPLDDNVWVADPTQARVRFIHVSPDAPAVDIWIDKLGKVFNAISFKSVGQYKDVAAGTYKLTAMPTSDPNTTVLSKSLTFEPGKVYTVYAVGQLKDNSLNTIISTDNAVQLQAPNTGQAQATVAGISTNLLLIVGLSLLALVSTIGLALAQRKQ